MYLDLENIRIPIWKFLGTCTCACQLEILIPNCSTGETTFLPIYYFNKLLLPTQNQTSHQAGLNLMHVRYPQDIHKLSGQEIGYTLRWEILMKAPPWNPISNICRLCTLEKHHILFHPEDSSLNQRSEFFTVCRHKERHLLMKS